MHTKYKVSISYGFFFTTDRTKTRCHRIPLGGGGHKKLNQKICLTTFLLKLSLYFYYVYTNSNFKIFFDSTVHNMLPQGSFSTGEVRSRIDRLLREKSANLFNNFRYEVSRAALTVCE